MKGGSMEAASIHHHPAQAAPPPVTQERPAVASWSPANPAPLGLAAFAMTTFVLSMFNANLVDEKGVPVVLGLALVYGGVVQLLAGMWEFRTGNTFGAVAFSSYGAFWISFLALNVFYAKSIGGNVGHAVGVYLWAWAIFTAYMTVAALRVNLAVLVVFVLLTAAFVLLAIGAVGPHPSVTHWGGYVGLATAAAAWYASFAAVLNSTFGRTVLPLVPLVGH
ncbi:MAG TPA: acetate uptake transporter [Solirubrobacteraceae bacterium]|nr:acetate uptake transporter [Solirubrobacteraceae bacterium]